MAACSIHAVSIPWPFFHGSCIGLSGVQELILYCVQPGPLPAQSGTHGYVLCAGGPRTRATDRLAESRVPTAEESRARLAHEAHSYCQLLRREIFVLFFFFFSFSSRQFFWSLNRNRISKIFLSAQTKRTRGPGHWNRGSLGNSTLLAMHDKTGRKKKLLAVSVYARSSSVSTPTHWPPATVATPPS